MKILAIEHEIKGTDPGEFNPHLASEARQVWNLHQAGIIREIYFRGDRTEAVLILECSDSAEAGKILGNLPLVEAGLIRFEIIPLIPYPGFARLFDTR